MVKARSRVKANIALKTGAALGSVDRIQTTGPEGVIP
jgi:hypothetical protein